LIVEKDPKSHVSEAYRTLRTNIQYSSFDEDIKTILVTSPSPSEGKSTTAANLALTQAQADKKVLLMDCDLRKPTVHKKFQISNEKGLSDYLVGEISFDEAVVKYSDNFYVMPSGKTPPNPAEMLGCNKMKDFFAFKKDEFDCIVIDSPPVLAVTDAQIMSTIVDGVILVVSSGETEKEAGIKAKELLLKVNANILGAVMCKVPNRSGKNYGYYYYYYGEEETKKKRRRIKKK
jgi:capsular exopolysaccharide synthesis family protein